MIHVVRILYSAAILLLILIPNPKAQPQQAVVSPGGASLALKNIAGRAQNLNDFRGKIVVLNFWATWCKPCREEMTILSSLDSRYREREVQFIAASADGESTRKQVPGFVRRLKVGFPVWVGATTADMQRFGLGEVLPATAIIDNNGAIVGRIIGVVGHADLQKRIEWLLGDRQTPAPAPLVNNLDPENRDRDIKQEGKH